MKSYIILIASILLCIELGRVYAQETVLASGGEAIGNAGNVSYSIGQNLYTTHVGEHCSVAHGVQQPFEISIIAGTDNAEASKLIIIAYPNPTNDVLLLRVENYHGKHLTYRVFDLNGRLLMIGKLTGSETRIPMNKYPPASYILWVFHDRKAMICFKVIKN
jgi:hypothetical protein